MSGKQHALVHYDTARKALAECRRVDEVKAIRDKSAAMRAYAKQANDRRLWMDAVEISARAERRLGELLIEAKRNGEIEHGGARRGSSPKNPDLKKLEDLGVGSWLSSDAQRLAAFSETDFERVIACWRAEAEEGNRVTVNMLSYATKLLRQDVGDEIKGNNGATSANPFHAVTKTLEVWFDLLRHKVSLTELARQVDLPCEVGDEEDLLERVGPYIARFVEMKMEQEQQRTAA